MLLRQRRGRFSPTWVLPTRRRETSTIPRDTIAMHTGRCNCFAPDLQRSNLCSCQGFFGWISQLAVRRAVKLAFPGRTMCWQNNLHSSLHVSWHGSWPCQIFLLADILIFAFRYNSFFRAGNSRRIDGTPRRSSPSRGLSTSAGATQLRGSFSWSSSRSTLFISKVSRFFGRLILLLLKKI